MHSLARTRPLIDGNKRLAWLATVVFLDINGYGPSMSGDEAFALVMDVAARDLELTRIVERLAVAPGRQLG